MFKNNLIMEKMMKLVVILNVNPDKNIKTKISNNRE